MSRPNLLLVPSLTELEWETIGPALSEWAEVATYDPPGVGNEPLAAGVTLDPTVDAGALLHGWRDAIGNRGVEEAERRGWERFFVVADSYGSTSAVRVAELAGGRVEGLALGHARLANTDEGDRPTRTREVFDAMGTLLRTDREAFIANAIAQITQGAVSEDLAARWLERLPDTDSLSALWDATGRESEPIGDRLRELELPLLLAEHAGCLLSTHEGFEDIVAAFPDAATVTCPEACPASPAFADALHEFASGER